MGHIENKQILVFGAGGQLGKEFQYLYEEEKFPGNYTFLIKEECNVTDQDAVYSKIANIRPDVIINCAAYTAVDRAEEEADLAYRINCDAVETMAISANLFNIPLVHFSTDYVYHGSQEVALKEDDPTDPSGIYAASKLAGEHRILDHHPNSLIFRTSWVYSMFGQNFVRTMLRLSQERKELKVVNDQIGSPTWARDLARTVLTIIDQHAEIESFAGLYNYSNLGQCSWYEFAKKIFEIAKVTMGVNPIPTSEYPTTVRRPAFSLLDKSKFINTFGIAIPHWETSLEMCLQEMI